MKYARRADGIPESKHCSQCKEIKTASAFYKDESKATCLSSRCKACIAAKAKDWKAANPDKVQADRDRYREEHKEWLRDRHAKQRFETKASIVAKLGGCCKRCGFSDHRALQFDHLDGSGAKERKSAGFDWWSWVRKLDLMSLPDLERKIQILCANCNQIKKVEDSEYGAGKKSRWESARNCSCVAGDRSSCRVHSHIGSGGTGSDRRLEGADHDDGVQRPIPAAEQEAPDTSSSRVPRSLDRPDIRSRDAGIRRAVRDRQAA